MAGVALSMCCHDPSVRLALPGVRFGKPQVRSACTNSAVGSSPMLLLHPCTSSSRLSAGLCRCRPVHVGPGGLGQARALRALLRHAALQRAPACGQLLLQRVEDAGPAAGAGLVLPHGPGEAGVRKLQGWGSSLHLSLEQRLLVPKPYSSLSLGRGRVWMCGWAVTLLRWCRFSRALDLTMLTVLVHVPGDQPV